MILPAAETEIRDESEDEMETVPGDVAVPESEEEVDAFSEADVHLISEHGEEHGDPAAEDVFVPKFIEEITPDDLLAEELVTDDQDQYEAVHGESSDSEPESIETMSRSAQEHSDSYEDVENEVDADIQTPSASMDDEEMPFDDHEIVEGEPDDTSNHEVSEFAPPAMKTDRDDASDEDRSGIVSDQDVQLGEGAIEPREGDGLDYDNIQDEEGQYEDVLREELAADDIDTRDSNRRTPRTTEHGTTELRYQMSRMIPAR